MYMEVYLAIRLAWHNCAGPWARRRAPWLSLFTNNRAPCHGRRHTWLQVGTKPPQTILPATSILSRMFNLKNPGTRHGIARPR